MKITNWAIAFTVLLTAISLPISISQDKSMKSEALKIKYNEVVDNAVKDASLSLMTSKDSSSIIKLSEGVDVNYQTAPVNLDLALWRFYQTMYLNLGIQNDYLAQQAFFNKVPIKLALAYDGYYINAWVEEYDSASSSMKVKEKWMDKKKYTLYDDANHLQIDFTLDNYVYVTNTLTHQTSYADYRTFTSSYPSVLAFKTDKFQSIKNQVITNGIMNDLSYYSEKDSEIAIKNGWKYTFKLPYSGNTTFTDIGFVAFLQGLPLNGGDLYNTYGFGTAQIIQAHKVYGKTVGGKKFYYMNYSPALGTDYVLFDSAAEAAKAGYYPDPAE